MTRMSSYLIAADGSAVPGDAAAVQRQLREGELYWLDLHQPESAELALLEDVFGIHPLGAEDADHFGQRPKLEQYDDFVQIVVYGARGTGDLVEVHCFYSEHYLVTVRREDWPAFDELRAWLSHRAGRRISRVLLLHHLLGELVDGFFPVLSGFDDRIEQLQDEIFARPTQDQLSELVTMKRWLFRVRKVVTPQRDLVASVVSGITVLPGMTAEAERYYRELYDHLIRINDLVDSCRDLLTSTMDAHLSIGSHRLNEVMKQLTVIATIFLPLTFLVGFFGQNFLALNRPVFLGVGIGIEVVALAAMLVLLRRRGLT